MKYAPNKTTPLNYYIAHYGAELSGCKWFLQKGIYSRVDSISLSCSIKRDAAHEDHMDISWRTASSWSLVSFLHHLEFFVSPCQLQAAHSRHCHVNQYCIEIACCISFNETLQAFDSVFCCLNIVSVRDKQLRQVIAHWRWFIDDQNAWHPRAVEGANSTARIIWRHCRYTGWKSLTSEAPCKKRAEVGKVTVIDWDSWYRVVEVCKLNNLSFLTMAYINDFEHYSLQERRPMAKNFTWSSCHLHYYTRRLRPSCYASCTSSLNHRDMLFGARYQR